MMDVETPKRLVSKAVKPVLEMLVRSVATLGNEARQDFGGVLSDIPVNATAKHLEETVQTLYELLFPEVCGDLIVRKRAPASRDRFGCPILLPDPDDWDTWPSTSVKSHSAPKADLTTAEP